MWLQATKKYIPNLQPHPKFGPKSDLVVVTTFGVVVELALPIRFNFQLTYTLKVTLLLINREQRRRVEISFVRHFLYQVKIQLQELNFSLDGHVSYEREPHLLCQHLWDVGSSLLLRGFHYSVIELHMTLRTALQWLSHMYPTALNWDLGWWHLDLLVEFEVWGLLIVFSIVPSCSFPILLLGLSGCSCTLWNSW